MKKKHWITFLASFAVGFCGSVYLMREIISRIVFRSWYRGWNDGFTRCRDRYINNDSQFRAYLYDAFPNNNKGDLLRSLISIRKRIKKEAPERTDLINLLRDVINRWYSEEASKETPKDTPTNLSPGIHLAVTNTIGEAEERIQKLEKSIYGAKPIPLENGGTRVEFPAGLEAVVSLLTDHVDHIEREIKDIGHTVDTLWDRIDPDQ